MISKRVTISLALAVVLPLASSVAPSFAGSSKARL